MADQSKSSGKDPRKPVIYACSGCSNVGQLANDIAVRLSRDGIADMSCIVGVSGNMLPLVQIATSGRKIIAFDGCSLGCVKAILKRFGVVPRWYFELSQIGLVEDTHRELSLQETYKVLDYVYQKLGLKAPSAQGSI